MYVVATAGHVDHGKSSLVKALTGMEPDRWEEEKRRGLTIDLGFVWTKLDSGADVAFVDVPGHEKFLGNMLVGVGPAPVVLFVVAADEGWQAQSTDHRDALRAVGIEHGVVALSRADRADAARRAEVVAQVETELAGTALADAPIVDVSAKTGEGVGTLRTELDQVLAAMPAPDPQARVRLWVDRGFSVKGAGTVVTGTLAAGTVSVGDELELHGQRVTVRGVHSENKSVDSAGPVTRVALNLRGVAADQVHRGDALLSPGGWRALETVDIRRTFGTEMAELPQNLVVHIGTAGVGARLRPLGGEFARLTLESPLSLTLLDRFVVRSPGGRHVAAGFEVVDMHPAALSRRGAAKKRAAELEALEPTNPSEWLKRCGYASRDDLLRDGFSVEEKPAGVIVFREWWIAARQVTAWKNALVEAVEAHAAANPLSPGLTKAAAMDALNLSEPALLGLAVAAAKLESVDGVLRVPGKTVDLGPAEKAVAELEQRLRAEPFAAPEAEDLKELGLGPKELAAAERAGRLLRLAKGVVLLPSAPRAAFDVAAQLEQPFTLSAARQALGTTRRVAVPLLEHLDATGATRLVEGKRFVCGPRERAPK
ncbi:selenocysteine-specific translation elongation factor [Corynebacterium aurimucosum]|uniref:selenocysteine-specific translation elongation factor n=1 Tax=Corynebacterium aurimucosum TaxID=169292 RepID=UPI00191F9C67|nr:selenocysteine-specific translation elongation factor [Corynebacterium aurimucosum]QQU95203.1 selenocysteine-specific translation elongation factor [Corynebacterium aurimucosum]UTA71891.1 selenocysteine-specific translation elongation factor [Corynebacterium aurimucosum]WJY70153.1 Selenocysteine-specific elongation factor [Corynebacterium aurimucosum]